MAGWGQVVTAVIMAVVVFAAVKGGGGPIAQAFENTAKIFGLDVGKPRIGSFTASPTADGDVRLELSIAGNKKDVVLDIYASKASDEAAPELKPPTPKFDAANLVVTTGEKADLLAEEVKNTGGIFRVTCPTDKICTKPDNYLPDWYRFSAVLKKKGKTVFQSEALMGFYDEAYVELLDKPIQGCDFPGMDNCNVVECKKTIMSEAADLFGVSQTARPELGKIVKEVTSGTCAAYDPMKTPVLSFSCSKGQVDDMNIKFSRIRMFRAAHSLTGLTLENDYNKFADQVGDFKQFGITNSLVCSNGEGLFKGAYEHLNSIGWLPVGMPVGGFDKWKGEIIKELDGVLINLKPGIAGIRADAFDDRHLGLSWKIPVGEDMVKAGSYKISHFRKRWERSVTPENQKVLQSEAVVAGQKGDGSVLTSFDTAAGQQTGKHEFEVRIFEKPGAAGSEFFLAKAATGMFDDAYIETYKGGVEGKCVTKGLGKDPAGLHECNVDAQKREELKALRTPAGKERREKVFAALEKAGVDAAKCEYEATGISLKYGLSDECTPEEVDRVWKNYMVEIGSADDYDCVLPLNSEAKSVCIVKRQTVNTLQTRGWKDLRVKKGWENNV